jgi:hypothetical protein
MTLVLHLANLDQVIQVSDRQLTGAEGVPRVLPECKATVLTLDNARLLVGYAGLARAGSLRTGECIVEALSEAAAQDNLALPTVERFKERLTERWRQPDIQAVPRQDRGLSVLFTGYNDGLPDPILISAIVTNFQNYVTGRDEPAWDEFKAAFTQVNPDASNPTYIQRVGAWSAMDDENDVARLREGLEQRRPFESIIEMACGLVREIARRPAAAGTIGLELNSAVLPAARMGTSLVEGVPIQMGFHPQDAAHAVRGVNHVISTAEGQVALMDPVLKLAEPANNLPLAVRRVGRNKPCPCGSRKKYKKCCGA